MRKSLFAALLLLLAACGSDDPVQPDPQQPDPAARFDGNYDGEALVMQRTDVPLPDGSSVPVDLVASRIAYDSSTQRLQVVVALRNASQIPLYAPARVGLSDFVPDTVLPLDADVFEDVVPRWWYDYSGALGEDGMLGPGEQSDGVLWTLQLPEPGSFSFAAVARFSPDADRPVLGGRVFQDLDRDGQVDPDEPGSFGDVEVQFPDGHLLLAHPREDGRWAVPVSEAGLYQARWISPPTFGFAPVCLTTPSPIQILLTPGPDGRPRSFRSANFGVDPQPCLPGRDMPILVSDAPPDSLGSAPWSLVDIVYVPPDAALVEGLEISVGISGCQPEHPLAFVILRPVDRFDPTRMGATIYHDDLGELCDAWFNVSRRVDVAELRRIWAAESGYEGPITLELIAPDGIHEVLLD